MQELVSTGLSHHLALSYRHADPRSLRGFGLSQTLWHNIRNGVTTAA